MMTFIDLPKCPETYDSYFFFNFPLQALEWLTSSWLSFTSTEKPWPSCSVQLHCHESSQAPASAFYTLPFPSVTLSWFNASHGETLLLWKKNRKPFVTLPHNTKYECVRGDPDSANPIKILRLYCMSTLSSLSNVTSHLMATDSSFTGICAINTVLQSHAAFIRQRLLSHTTGTFSLDEKHRRGIAEFPSGLLGYVILVIVPMTVCGTYR